MWGVAGLGWMAAAGLALALHQTPWWIYFVTFATLALTAYIGWAALDAATGMGVISLAGTIGAAALLYLHHVAWWIYLVVGSACWIGVSIGRAASAAYPRAVDAAGEPQGSEAG